MVRIRPGQKVPIDGVVHDGVTHIDQKVITGESLMVEAGTGSEVFAGTVNGDGLIQIEVIRQLKDSIVSQIARKVSQAQTKRAPIERIVDQFARFYTPAIVLIASLIVILPPLYFQFLNQPTNWQDWLFRGLVLLVIACPCALVISTPVAVVCALANSAKNGILVREGFVIEQFSQLQLIAFDKTGTLTQGRPQVQEIMKLSDKLTESDIIGMAAALGQAGSHVVSRSLVDYAEDNVINIPEANEVKEIPGLGTTGYINQQLVYLGSHRFIDKESLCSPAVHQIVVAAEKSSGTGVMIASKENAIAWIRLVDQPRKESAKMISDLKKMKIATMMLTGDNFNTAGEIAAMIGIEDYRAGLLPHEKSDLIEKLVQKEFKRVGMVGDGVNDAPSLVAATVGISMGDIASAITSQAADVVLINNNLNSISRLVRISKATNFIIHTNIILAIFSKFLVLILAVSGYANFLLAMLSDVGISIIVILNSLRLLKFEMKN
jgi:Cd2+/Zn2+-exporting ATPase